LKFRFLFEVTLTQQLHFLKNGAAFLVGSHPAGFFNPGHLNL
jgi:hypothetical protein